eukprot:TRINITY_DN51499_c0_g1_i1.p1 TRINITY_DN51499_c0_g1~~TRINITY_DN51499_c0_g1_i1.p1  ORF type:complete len:551 (-),score=105.03 TRINITY_DN51499_c0_g1_i1:194-1846(-)
MDSDGSDFEYADGSVGGSASEFEYEDDDRNDADMRSEADDDDDQMVIEPPEELRKAPYTIMNRAELAERQAKSIEEASDLFQVSAEESFVLLRAHAWDLQLLQEAWFTDDRKVREQCGLHSQSAPGDSSSSTATGTGKANTCAICMSSVPQDEFVALDCSHGFCTDCWTGYLHSKVDEGKASVLTTCPEHKCPRIVPLDFFDKFCDEARQQKYREWRLMTYVDENASVKWCSNPAGCAMACEFQGMEPCEIRCACNYHWCWACGEEAHRPASCSTVKQWNIKNSNESENISWIRANTKNCPKCHKPIEKNQGCNHMVCSKAGGCGHEFCWLCLGEWSTHGTSTGGYYQCNIYDKQAKEGRHDEHEKGRLKAKHALDKYIHYYERFTNHDKSMKLTIREEQQIEQKVQTLHDKNGFAIIELQFLYDALRQVRSCRRVLKWTYVYGYYLDEARPTEKNLFEFLQRNLEEKTDALHEMLERDFQMMFFDEEGSVSNSSSEDAVKKFMAFRSHATNFTNVTQKFLVKILNDIGSDAGLAAPDSDGLVAGERYHL